MDWLEDVQPSLSYGGVSMCIYVPLIVGYFTMVILFIILFIIYFKLVMWILLFVYSSLFLMYKLVYKSHILENPIYEFILAIIASLSFIYIIKFIPYNLIPF